MATEARIVINAGPQAALTGRAGLSGWARTIAFTDGTSQWLLIEGDGVRAIIPAGPDLLPALTKLAVAVAGEGNFAIEKRTV